MEPAQLDKSRYKKQREHLLWLKENDPAAYSIKLASKRAAQKRWDDKNKDKLKAKRLRWASKNEASYRRKERENNPKNSMLRRCKHRAKLSGVPFNLTKEDIILPSTCPVFNIKLDYSTNKNGKPKSNSPSIDRLVPTLGYTKENCRVISNRANRIKSDASKEDLLAIINYIEKETSNALSR